METEPKHHNIQELNRLFQESVTADQELWAEQRSNVQLIAGEHYARKGNKFWNRVRDSKDLTSEQKIRLTKNHIRKIVLIYRNAITGYAPGVQAGPKDKSSLQHQKSAELVNAVWQDGKNRHDFNRQINQWASDFTGIGEVAVKIFFDPNAGKFLGTEARVDELGNVEVDENGQPVSSGTPKFNGDVTIERLFGFNLGRSPGAKSMRESPFIWHRKMVQNDDIKGLIDSNPDFSDEEKTKLKAKVQDSMDQTYIVLDGNSGQYKTTKGQTMLKEWFFRPCMQYPNGYFYICTTDDIIFEGELPFGIFPIIFEGMDEIQTSPRYRSIVKQLRPYQIEINRCASKIAEHQVTLGDDKILVQNGTKLVPGVALPGVRSFQYQGAPPIVMQGRSGEQFVNYMTSQIAEMYSVAMIDEQVQEKNPGQFDVYSMLARSIKDKKKFSVHTDSFESFLKQVFKTYIELCQKYFGPQHLVPAVGKSEYINIDEFKKVEDICYNIILEAQSDDSETKLGKQLMLQHLIQYVGPQLAKDDLGKIIKLMPYANDEMISEDLTLNFDMATNYILMMDRGKSPAINKNADVAYLVKRFTARQTKADYDTLHPFIKQIYDNAIASCEEIKTQQTLAIKQAESEFIPTGGYLVASDFYVPDPNNPQKLPKRVRLPSESLAWLIDKLNAQGSDQQTLEGINKGALSDMAKMLVSKMGMPGQRQMLPGTGTTTPQAMPQTAQTSAMGANRGY